MLTAAGIRSAAGNKIINLVFLLLTGFLHLGVALPLVQPQNGLLIPPTATPPPFIPSSRLQPRLHSLLFLGFSTGRGPVGAWIYTPAAATLPFLHDKVAIFHRGTQSEPSTPTSTNNNPVFHDVHSSRLIKHATCAEHVMASPS